MSTNGAYWRAGSATTISGNWFQPTPTASEVRVLFSLLTGALLLSACAIPPTPEPRQHARDTEVPPMPVAAGRVPNASMSSAPPSNKPRPIPVRAINVATDCNFRDETGYNGRMKLSIEKARIQAFEATVNIPRRGACRFDLKNFRQTRELPTVELSHLRDRCVVRVWEQGERITVTFQDCRKRCSGNAWEHLWPILNDTRDGSCA